MSNQALPGTDPSRTQTANAQREITVTAADLPLHCPTPDETLWDSHPQVFLDVEKTGEATCPYCGTHYVLKREQAD